MSQQVVAAVPTYRPDPERLLPLLDRINGWGVPTVVIDDASPCTSDPVIRRAADVAAIIRLHRSNAGIGRSLEESLRWASALRADWLLTVDQDSTPSVDYLPRLLDVLREVEAQQGILPGALGAGVIEDPSGTIAYPTWTECGVTLTHEVIASGTLWSVPLLVEVGGFDASLGMDAVDASACLRLRQAGHRIAVAPQVRLDHRMGAGRQVSLLGRQVHVSGHSPTRRTSMIRNRLRLFPAEFAQSPVHALRTLRRTAVGTALAVTVEQDRRAKASAALRALGQARRDGGPGRA